MSLAAEELARLRLIRSENVGPVTFRQLLARFGTARAAVDALPDIAQRAGRRSFKVTTAAEAEAECDRVARIGARILHLGLAPYPSRLAEIEDAPPVLVARGDLRLLDRPAIALVGARNASAGGMRLARDWAGELAAAGLAVVSGLARGIDAAAHGGAAPHTIAAVAGGADIAYPPELADLQRQIGEGGLLIAEQPLGTNPQARHFPRRNRIISGLSRGVVVIEAALGSGSLITARNAAEQGREVMAIPGHPLDPRSAGGNALIRDGATLVTCAAEALDAASPHAVRAPLRPARAAEQHAPFEPAPRELDALARLLGPTPVHLDEIARQSGLDARALAVMVTDLELAGRLERHAGARVALAA